MDIIPIQWVNQ